MRQAIIIGVVIVVCVSGVVVWKLVQQSRTSTPIVVSVPIAAAQQHEGRTIPAGWREYRSATYRFSLLYLQELAMNEHVEEGGAMTITFQNPDKGEGFQIFIVPYNESQVSPARFKMDIPSGVRTDMTDVTIDGAVGAAFYSTHALLGDTREVWFIKGGYLYEVTTLKPLEAELVPILQTWQFI